jgi:phospholipase/carboxylesterase
MPILTHTPLRCMDLTPEGAAPRGTVVYLHGMGATLEDMVSVVDDMAFPARHLLLDGPLEQRMGEHYAGRAWYSRGEDGAISGLEEAAGHVARTLEVLGVDVARSVLVGFSQGAAMALVSALKLPVAPAGLGMLAGYVANQGLLAAHRDRVASLYVLSCHGIHDDVVPVKDGLDALDMLAALGARARLVALPTSHWVSGEMVVELRRFLDERLPR